MSGDPLCLAIETSNPSADPSAPGEVALARCSDWTGHEAQIVTLANEVLSPAARHDDALMPAIERLFIHAGVDRAALRRIAVSIGPGGYSAIRIAIATARMIAEVTGAACVPVDSAVVAAQASGLPERFTVLLASKRDTVWATPFSKPDDGPPRAIVTGALVDAAAFDAMHRGVTPLVIVADDNLPEPFRSLAASRGWPVTPIRLRAAALLKASRGVAGVLPEALAPLYPREAEAVRKWRELGRANPR